MSIHIQEFKNTNQLKLESFLNSDAVRLGWKILSIQKINIWFQLNPNWIVAYEKVN